MGETYTKGNGANKRHARKVLPVHQKPFSHEGLELVLLGFRRGHSRVYSWEERHDNSSDKDIAPTKRMSKDKLRILYVSE
jgi:hypothetical protein